MSPAATHPLVAAFSRFGVAISPAEAQEHHDRDPGEAILMLLANREIAARFDAAHSRPPEEADIAALLEVYKAMAERG